MHFSEDDTYFKPDEGKKIKSPQILKTASKKTKEPSALKKGKQPSLEKDSKQPASSPTRGILEKATRYSTMLKKYQFKVKFE